MANITRQQLAQFLPTPELIRTFEELFLNTNTEIPTNIDELLQQLGSARQFQNLTPILNRLVELELLAQQKSNLKPLLNRIEELENLVNRNPNLTGLIQRIEKIENFLGI